MCLTHEHGYQIFLVFAPMISLLTLDNNKNISSWISTAISPEKVKLFDTNLELTMSNLANSRVILKFNNSVWVEKSYYSLYSSFILILCIVYELNNWPQASINNFPREFFLFGRVKLVRKAIKNKFMYHGSGIAFDG